MWSISQPWWELVLRAAIVYTLPLVLICLSGRQTMGQFTPFDLLVVMLLSESMSDALSGGDDTLAAGLLSAATPGGLEAGGGSGDRAQSGGADGAGRRTRARRQG